MGVYKNTNAFGETEWIIEYQRINGRGINVVRGYFKDEASAKKHVSNFSDCERVNCAVEYKLIT